jgi:hypothetical protein
MERINVIPINVILSEAKNLPVHQPSAVSINGIQGSEFRVQHSSLISHPSSFPPASSLQPPASNHVVLTGGEPMLFAELIPLAAALRERGWHITVETAGTLYLPVACDLMSISPKLSNSAPPPEPDPRWAERHARQRHAPDVIRRLLAHHAKQTRQAAERGRQVPAPGYRPETLDVLFGNDAW